MALWERRTQDSSSFEAAAESAECNQRNSIACPPQQATSLKNGYVIPPLVYRDKVGPLPVRSAPPAPVTENKSTFTSSRDEPDCCSTVKPALPPKPGQGPPIYREPPRPPPPHRDIFRGDLDSRRFSRDPSQQSCSLHSTHGQETSTVQKQDNASHQEEESNDAPAQAASRTQAWVQEHKSSGKLVGERLTSLQRKLRSLLTQSPQSANKDSSSVNEKSATKLLPQSSDSKCDGLDNPSLSLTSNETNQRMQNASSTVNLHSSTEPSYSDHRLSYISTSSVGSSSVATTISPPVTQGQPVNVPDSRHPFQAASNNPEHEDITDTVHLRDTCNRLFTREQRSSWSNYLSPRNCYSNNIKSAYDYDKLVPKEAIGRPCQEKKTIDTPPNQRAIYEGITPPPSIVKPPELPKKQPPLPEAKPSMLQEARHFYMRELHHFEGDTPLPDVTPKETKVSNQEFSTSEGDAIKRELLRDGGDTSDQYKSSSESGRGTMHSGMHGSKGPVSPHSSGVSAASNLDTSLDSDHSVSGALWKQQKHRVCPNHGTQISSSGNQGTDAHCGRGKQTRHTCDTHYGISSSRKTADKEQNADLCDDASGSESLSVTPPLPPLSPPPSPPISTENSPQVSPKSKYKLSLSTNALNSYYSKSQDHQPKTNEASKSGPNQNTPNIKNSCQGKKTGVRRTSSITQSSCRHWGGKGKGQCRNTGMASGHRLGVVHGGCSSRKNHSSPPARHSRIPLAYPCFSELADPELTSTTTGLDMESLLDDPEDYSSDLSATASTMDPTEVSMIRKQLEGLETMYSEILRLLGVKNSPCKMNSRVGSSSDLLRHSKKRVHGSLSSLTGRSSVSRGTHSIMDKRGYSERRRSKDHRSGAASKRLQRLESHVVTLARSVAHLSSEMRTQHVLVQELENMRRDVTWVQERLRLMQLAHSGAGFPGCSAGGKGQQIPLPRDWDQFRKEVLELLNPSRAKKLTKFFGDEPPLIRQFLKRLGYEKYAPNFEAEKIGIMELPYLTEERLQKIGIPMGPRMRILQEAHASSQQSQYKVYIV